MESSSKKMLISVLIVLMGTALLIPLGNAPPVSAYQSSGIAIDFGERNVTWVDVDLNACNKPAEVLEYACSDAGFSLTVENGNVTEINGTANDGESSWGFWVIERGSLEWIKTDRSDLDLRYYSVSSWAFCGEEETPAVGVDQYGQSIYGYPRANRTVSLSPALTEIIGALNAVNTLVGTDAYSTYPEKVAEGQQKGDISVVGGYVNPSFEAIMKTDPDVVFCDGNQYSHYEMAERVRKMSVNAIVLYRGDSTETIQNNIYIMGTVMGYEIRALTVISELKAAESEIVGKITDEGMPPSDVMVALSPDKSPWVAGGYTYFSDVVSVLLSKNVFSDKIGWVQVNSESIPRANPSVIIVISEQYGANESEYRQLLDSLSAEWRNTDAYENGNVLLFGESLSELAQRPGPRYAQLMEILYLALQPSSDLPKYIGDDYRDYLEITEFMGYD